MLYFWFIFLTLALLPSAGALLIMHHMTTELKVFWRYGSGGDLAAGVEFWDLGQSCNGGENSLGTFNRGHF